MKFLIYIIFIFLFHAIIWAQYPRYQQIVAAEYFINSDPGEGNGIPITGNFGSWEVELNVNQINLPLNSKIYVRVKSSNGTWSAPRSIKRENYFTNLGGILNYGEYFINDDPGVGQGIPIDISTGETLIKNLKIKRGDKVYVRVKDNFNRWSHARCVTFNYKDLVKAEYYVKTSAGITTQPELMIISRPSDSSSVFIAYKENINFTVRDTFFVRFQSADKFYSKWTKGPLSDPTSIVFLEETPLEYNLFQNFPNPFNSSTKIKYSIKTKELVKIKLYDLLGREVATLVDEEKDRGLYEIDFNASKYGLSSGIYFYKLNTGKFTSIKKMLYLK